MRAHGGLGQVPGAGGPWQVQQVQGRPRPSALPVAPEGAVQPGVELQHVGDGASQQEGQHCLMQVDHV